MNAATAPSAASWVAPITLGSARGLRECLGGAGPLSKPPHLTVGSFVFAHHESCRAQSRCNLLQALQDRRDAKHQHADRSHILGKLARDNGSVRDGDGERKLVRWSQAVREGVRARGSHRGRQGQHEGTRHRPEPSDLPVPAGPPRVRPRRTEWPRRAAPGRSLPARRERIATRNSFDRLEKPWTVAGSALLHG